MSNNRPEQIVIAWTADCPTADAGQAVELAINDATEWIPVELVIRPVEWHGTTPSGSASLDRLASFADVVCVMSENGEILAPICLELLDAGIGYTKQPLLLTGEALGDATLVQIQSIEAIEGVHFTHVVATGDERHNALRQLLIDKAKVIAQHGRGPSSTGELGVPLL